MICVPSVYSVSFISDNLADSKYRMIKQMGTDLLKLRQNLSLWTQNNLIMCSEMSKFDYLKNTQHLIKFFESGNNLLQMPLTTQSSSHFYKAVQVDVFTAYSNRLEAIKRRMVCKLYLHEETQYYKRDTKTHKKGTVRKIIYKEVETDVTRTVSFLAKYGAQKEYKHEYMQRVISKFGLDRLLAVAAMRRENVLKRYSEPINFTSLTFRGRSRLDSDIINRNKKSVIKGFVTLSWPGLPGLSIPVKLHSKYHKNLHEFSNGRDTSYIIQINRKEIRVILTRDGDRYFPDVSVNEHEITGCDVNVKHNMVITDNGYEIQHEHKLVKAVLDHEKRTDELKLAAKKIGETYTLGKRRKAKSDMLSGKYIDYIEREAAKCCKTLYSQGKRHVVFEDLQGCWGKTYASSTLYDVNHNRLTKAMHIASVKDVFMRIAPKYGIAVSLVNPAYTSQTCPECGCVDQDNRLTQEEFECIECGYKNNADKVGALNTGHRIANAVLRDELSVLNKNKTGFEPTKMKYKDVKSVLLKCRTIVWNPKRGEPV
jgi:IS605 OrfB family transposase